MLTTERLDVDDVREEFRTDFEETARWRMEKAAEYPHDAARNIEAAGICQRLAGTVDEIPREMLQQFCDAWAEISTDGWAMLEWPELQSELFRGIGFDSAWPTAADYVEYMAKELRRLATAGR